MSARAFATVCAAFLVDSTVVGPALRAWMAASQTDAFSQIENHSMHDKTDVNPLHMYVCVCVYIYIYVSILHMHMYVHIYIHVWICTYIYIYVYTYTYVRI